jgi:uncharacterized membrane protein
MIKINKKFYLVSFIVLGGLSVLLFLAGLLAGVEAPHYLVIYPSIIMFLIGLVFHYRAWKAIQDGTESTTPVKAVGFLFIPVYNLYWLFRTLEGFAKDFNSYKIGHQIEAKDLPEGLYFFQCVLIILMVVLLRFEAEWLVYPTLAVMLWVYINTLVIISKSANAVNAIYESQGSSAADE